MFQDFQNDFAADAVTNQDKLAIGRNKLVDEFLGRDVFNKFDSFCEYVALPKQKGITQITNSNHFIEQAPAYDEFDLQD